MYGNNMYNYVSNIKSNTTDSSKQIENLLKSRNEMSTVKEKKKKEKKIQYKRWRFRETWNKKTFTGFKLEAIGPYR